MSLGVGGPASLNRDNLNSLDHLADPREPAAVAGPGHDRRGPPGAPARSQGGETEHGMDTEARPGVQRADAGSMPDGERGRGPYPCVHPAVRCPPHHRNGSPAMGCTLQA